MEVAAKYRPLAQYIEDGVVEAAVVEARRLVEAGDTVTDIFQQAIVPCMSDIGDRFSSLELFLPDMIRAADVVKAIHAGLADVLQGEAAKVESAGKIVIGTVSGDIHDIGKNIVRTMLEVNGFDVVDLGVDVAAQDFIKRAKEVNADIIALSSLMTTSIPYMEDVIELITASEQDRGRFKILVGGGPITPEVAQQMGADGFGEDAADAVRQARRLLK